MGIAALVTALFAVMLPLGAVESPVQQFPHVDGDADYKDDFGVFARERIHMGIDIFSPKGTPVTAVADGFILRMSRSAKSGYYIVLRHAEGWESFYLHLNNDSPGTDDDRGGKAAAFAEGLSAGDYVEAGTVIGYVGDSGNAEQTASHTHFELHRNGRAVDPYPWVHIAKKRWDLAVAIEAGETTFR